MTATCEIRWVDCNGNPTPDSNPAIGLVRCKARVEQRHGRAISFSESRWFHICAEHARQLDAPGMHIWECAGLDPMDVDTTDTRALAWADRYPPLSDTRSNA